MSVKTLVLGSLGLFGVAHCGVLQKLDEADKLKSFSAIVASGSGCMIAGLLTCGVPIKDITDFCIDLHNSVQVKILNIVSGSVLDSNIVKTKLTSIIVKYYRSLPTLSELYSQTKIALVMCAYNLSERKSVRFRYNNYGDLSLVDVIMACTSIPLLYSSYSINNNKFSDASLSNPYPTDIMKGGEGIGISFNLASDRHTNDPISCITNYLSSPIGTLQLKNRSNKNYLHIIVTVRTLLGVPEDYQIAYNLTSSILDADCIHNNQ
jgi:predicted acylesterase/phospholipase RssA